MKKSLSVTLLALSAGLVLAGCGDQGGTTEDTTTEDTAAQEEQVDTASEDTATEDTESEDTESEDTASDETATGDLQDGTYRIEDQNFGETGWQEALEITVADGEITDANWESVDEEGNNKIEDEDYQETMTEQSGLGPQDFIPALEESLVENQDPSQVEVVSGATSTSEKFQDYASQLVEAAQEGNTETIQVDNAD